MMKNCLYDIDPATEAMNDDAWDDELYEKYDAAYAYVTKTTRHGANLIMENGQFAFAFGASSLGVGTTVICTVYRAATKARDALVKIDTVLYDDLAA